MELYITLVIIGIGIFLFVREYFSIDTTSILIMSLFIVTGVLDPEEGFSGFNHPATLTLGCMFVVSSAIFKTGLIEGLSARIIKLAKKNYFSALVTFSFISGISSAFINDSAVVSILIPMVLLVCREANISPARLLIPVSFSALMGGTCTLIGTSTNILVGSYAEKSGLPPFGMFEFTLPAVCLMAIGFLYMFVAGPLLLPNRKKLTDENFIQEAEKYIAEIKLVDQSPDINQKVSNTRLIKDFSVQVLALIRNNDHVYDITGDTILKRNDVVKIIISPQNLSRLKQTNGYSLSDDSGKVLEETEEKQVYEVMIPYGSDLAGNSLEKLDFRNVYHASVLAIRHRDETITQHLPEVVLKEGDMLLLYAGKTNIAKLAAQKLVVTLSKYKARKVDYKKAVPALLIGIGVVAAAALNITSLLISAMVGSLLLIITSILKPKEAYQAIQWKVIFMMAGVLSRGKALE
ncbi:MAG: transport protein containing TrkA C-terminal domain [Adhaeribacter sp.]|nr:transport protein containing TrkA C-terminal domain [Adhaeribacter sp.]